MVNDQYLIEVRVKRSEVPSFDAYPFSLDAVRGLDTLPLHPSVTFLVGENGSGKSTLLESIAVAWGLNPEGGSKNFSFRTRQSHSCLNDYLTLVRGVMRPQDAFFLRAESFFNLATEIEKLDDDPLGGPSIASAYGDRSLHEQSHGESFMSLLMERFRGKGLYILDEPEAALSPSRLMGMIARMHDLVESGSQFIIATHSPIIMAYPDALIYELNSDGVVEKEYEETEHYQLTKDFVNNYKRIMPILMGDDE